MQAENDILDIKPLFYESLPYLRFIIICIIFIIIGVVLFYLYKKIRARFKPKSKEQHIVMLCFYTLTRQALNNLSVPNIGSGLDAAAREKAAQFQFELSSILKLFIEKRFEMNATDLTTEELLKKLSTLESIDFLAGSLARQSLRTILTRGDEVKYARSPMSEKDLAENKQFVYLFLDNIEKKSLKLQEQRV